VAERTVVDCDKCGKEAKESLQIRIPHGSKREGPPEYPETRYLFQTRDLCTTCAESLINYLLAHRKVLRDGSVDFIIDRIHPEGERETDVIKLTRKYFGIKAPK
jgi:hypothetical protein